VLKFITDFLQCSGTTVTSRVFEWCAQFRDGRQSVDDDVGIGEPHTALTADNINRVENCILEDRRMTVHEIAAELSPSVSSVEKSFVNIINSLKCLPDVFQNN